MGLFFSDPCILPSVIFEQSVFMAKLFVYF